MESDQRGKLLLALGLSLGNFMTSMNLTIVIVAIPTIMQYFNTSILTAGWIAMAPLVTITGLIVPVGKLADIMGRKRVYLLGVIIFMMGSLLCGISHSMTFLIAASILQSIGTAAVLTCGPAILAISFPPGHIGKALGLVGIGVSVGALIGPSGGGYIIEYAGWRFIYLVSVPIGLINFMFMQWSLSDDAPQLPKWSFDVAGAVSFFVFTLFFLLTLNKWADLGRASQAVLAMGMISVLSIIFFIRQEILSSDPIINLRLFRNTLLTTSIISRILFFVLSNIFNFTIPFYLQRVLHYHPSLMGLIICTAPLVRLISGPLSGWISDSIGTRWLATAGMLILGLVALSLTTMGESATSNSIIGRFLIFGFAMGIFAVANMSALIGSVDRRDLGFASSSIPLFRNLGMAIGIAAANFVINLSLPGANAQIHAVNEAALLTGLENSWWLAAALGFMGAVISLAKGSKKIKDEQSV